PPNGKNITEWCKRKECWERVRELNVDLGRAMEGELIDVSKKIAPATANQGVDAPNQDEQGWINTVTAIPADTWFEISKWAKETGNLQPWQRSLSFSIGKLVGRSAGVSIKQAKHGVVILDEVTRLGFKSVSHV